MQYKYRVHRRPSQPHRPGVYPHAGPEHAREQAIERQMAAEPDAAKYEALRAELYAIK